MGRYNYRRRSNKSGSISVQVYKSDINGQRHIKTMGTGQTESELLELEKEARAYICDLTGEREFNFDEQPYDRIEEDPSVIYSKPVVSSEGPELILGKLFDEVGFGVIDEPLFRSIVLSRLVYPASKLKTTEYLYYHKRKEIEVSQIYRFLDWFYENVQERVQDIAYNWTKNLLGGKVNVLSYDMTTLHFESDDEDDLKKIGYSKNGKFQSPQIMLGLLVSTNGYPIGYNIYPGNTYEGHTLVPILESMTSKYNLGKPVIIADSGLLSKENMKELERAGYKFIIGARIKSESPAWQSKILEQFQEPKDGSSISFDKGKNNRLIVNYSERRAKRDFHNRNRGIARLQKNFSSGKITKKSINNRGYNKLLSITGGKDIKIIIDEEKIALDAKWDGLKGYVTNSELSPQEVIDNYKQLWNIEKAFRISKTDLRVRPIYHYRQRRIEAHICIAFVAYAIFKELERRIAEDKSITFSVYKAIEMTKTIFKVTMTSKKTKKTFTSFADISNDQATLLRFMGYKV